MHSLSMITLILQDLFLLLPLGWVILMEVPHAVPGFNDENAGGQPLDLPNVNCSPAQHMMEPFGTGILQAMK